MTLDCGRISVSLPCHCRRIGLLCLTFDLYRALLSPARSRASVLTIPLYTGLFGSDGKKWDEGMRVSVVEFRNGAHGSEMRRGYGIGNSAQTGVGKRQRSRLCREPFRQQRLDTNARICPRQVPRLPGPRGDGRHRIRASTAGLRSRLGASARVGWIESDCGA